VFCGLQPINDSTGQNTTIAGKYPAMAENSVDLTAN
jgi:hypothetical protein